MKVTMLIDNRGDESIFKTEWGLSALIEYDGHKILLDTGSSGQFAENAALLGISLQDVECGVLSHAHYDHADGMDVFFEENAHAPFYLQSGSAEDLYGLKDDGEYHYIGIKPGILEAYKDRIRFVSGVTNLFPGVWVIPHRKKDYSKIAVRSGLFKMKGAEFIPDNFLHEQSLVFETEKGLVVMNSCSHTGIANILSEVRAEFPDTPIHALIGGLHLYKLNDDEIKEAADLIRSEKVEKVLTGHCTGDHPFELLRQLLGSKVEQFETGMVLEF